MRRKQSTIKALCQRMEENPATKAGLFSPSIVPERDRAYRRPAPTKTPRMTRKRDRRHNRQLLSLPLEFVLP